MGEDAMMRKTESKIEYGLLLEIKEQCLVRTRGYIAERNFIMAVAPALRNFQMAKRIFGCVSAEYVEADLMLAKVHLGLRKYNFVSKTVSQLNVEMDLLFQKELNRINESQIYKQKISQIKKPNNLGENLVTFPFVLIPLRVVDRMNPDLIALQGRIQHLAGVFFQSLGEKQLSVKLLGDAAYFLSLAYGPTGLKTSLCYLEMAKSMLIGEKPGTKSHQVLQAMQILNIAVDIWNTAIRRAMNIRKTIQFEFSEIGEPRLLLQDAKAVFALFKGMDTYEYIKATTTLCLLFSMYDGDYEAVIEAKVARRAV